ncbi:Hypothetical_protein [Hexamita inflata]|uniref:Hypothetical_protein n=1 Tax=Hexamita inflata TaxID=28002 RepID=A0AA86UM03_9EUKA|nr:Hypothetical protein HINF_LOCUS48359 [Hexamita inflata]
MDVIFVLDNVITQFVIDEIIPEQNAVLVDVEAIKLIFIIQTSAIDVEVSYTHDIKLAELTYCTIAPYDYISNNFIIIYCIQIGVACVSPIRPAEMDYQSELLENSDRLDTTHIQILNNNKFAMSPIIPPQKVKLNLSAIIQDDVRQLAKILWSVYRDNQNKFVFNQNRSSGHLSYSEYLRLKSYHSYTNFCCSIVFIQQSVIIE